MKNSIQLILLLLFANVIAHAQPAQPPCDPVIGKQCKSIVSDTTLNPYVTGVLGNWRANRSLVFYASRNESDPNVQTNIRKDGVIKDFSAYWSFQAGALKSSTDTVKWVWNSESTIFNKKGVELENKDPLGRFNAGIYGYDLTLPVAVIQNSRYRESAFDGFEDYHMANTNCTEACPSARHLDFSAYASMMDTTEHHTGKRSLKLTAVNNQAGITTSLKPESSDTVLAKLKFTPQTGACGGAVLLKQISAGKEILLPAFSPVPGRDMVVSAWVKESQDCKCTSYQNSDIAVVITKAGGGEISYVIKPSGSIIEGWQRIDSVFTLPADAVSMTVSMRSSGSYNTWFDDFRIHPYHANMKSFVYNPVNLRLMAEMDENNYASFYEYDEEGTVIRVKKETIRGIKTIKETRSAMAQQ